MKNGLWSHLDELKKKHRKLDEEIQNIEKHSFVTDELRRLKTQKLWLKDEIHRVAKQLQSDDLNGF